MIAVTASSAGTSIAVQNAGTGIAPADVGKIFERFYRVDASRADSGMASGLGLAIIKTIMDLHRGRASVQSEVGGLTTFELYFPAPG